MSKEGKTGVTANTPKNVFFGAGTIHKNLAFTTPEYSLTSDVAVVAGKTYYTRSGSSPNYTYTVVSNPQTASIGTYYERSGGWNFADSVVGATNGGSTLTITPEFYDVPVDGANVAIKGLKKKVGETATLEVNFAELTEDLIKASTIASSATASEDATMDVITPNADVAAGDYWTNIAFVGKTLEGKNVIAILENALCTSGLPISGTNREGATIKATFACHADIADGNDLDVLPWKIYYPKATI